MKAIVEALKYCDNCEFSQNRNKCGKFFIGDSKCKFPDDFFKLKDSLFSELLEADKDIRLGRAVKKALRYGWMVHAVDVKDPDDCDTEVTEEAFDTVEDLLEWAEQEKKK